MTRFPSTMLAQTGEPKDVQAADLDLLEKINRLAEAVAALEAAPSNLVAYANNAAAVAAGLGIGDLYRIGDTVGVVHA